MMANSAGLTALFIEIVDVTDRLPDMFTLCLLCLATHSNFLQNAAHYFRLSGVARTRSWAAAPILNNDYFHGDGKKRMKEIQGHTL